MSIYHNNLRYQGKLNSELGLMVVEFDPVVGATSSYLSMNPVIAENFDGSRDFDFGAKFSERLEATVSFTKLDNNQSRDFTQSEVRTVLKWLTGSKKVSWLDLLRYDGTIDCSILGRFTDVKIQKMDSRTVGFRAVFRSVSPWAYSPVQASSYVIGDSGQIHITLDNPSDDLYSYVYPKVIFKNTDGEYLTIFNDAIEGDKLTLNNLSANETVLMDSNQIIRSDKEGKVFGEDFNYKWLRLAPGVNEISIYGHGEISIEYRYPIKIGDGATDIENILPTCGGIITPDNPEQGDTPSSPSYRTEQADWNAKPGESGYVKNRTHWVEQELKLMLPEITPAYNAADNAFYQSGSLPLQDEQQYYVIWNNKDYSVPAANNQLITNDFVISNTSTGTIRFAPLNGATSVEVAIYQITETVYKLDNKFLDIEPMSNDEIDVIFNEVMGV